MSLKTGKHYFAFISYKREDEEWAKWFQNELENYHLPSTLNGRDDLPESFRPVFRDIDELKAGNLPEQIYNALATSLNLVVICSSQLADDENAKWVNKEIRDFIEIGKKEGTNNIGHIFPFIVEGVPHAGDERECFPRALRELSKEQERIGGNINEGGNVSDINRERAFVKVLAGMLPDSVSFDMLWNRYDRDKMERERKEKEERDKLLIAQSRFVAEKALNIIKEDSYLARRLAMEVLPKDLDTQDRPYTAEAEAALRNACNYNSAVFQGHSEPAKAFFSPDGRLVVSVSWDCTIRVWEVATGKEIRFKKRENYVFFAAFTPDGNSIISADWDFTIRIWDLKTDSESVLLSSSNVALFVAVSPDGKRIVSTHQCGLVYLISESGAKKMDGHSDDVTSASFSPDGRSIVTASFDGTIRIWDAFTGKELKRNKASTLCSFRSASYSPDGKLIVSCGNEQNSHDMIRNALIHIWDANTLEEKKEFVVLRNNASILTVSFSPDGKSIVWAAEDNRVRIWNVENGKELKQLKVSSVGISANPSLYAAFSPDGRKVVCTPADGTVQIWDLEQDVYYKELRSIFDIHSIAFSSDGQYLVSSYDKNNIGIKITMPENSPFKLGLGDCIGIWSIDEYGAVLRELVGHEGYVNSVSFSTDGQLIVSSSLDNTIRIWDAETGTQLKKIKHVSGDNSSVSFSMDGMRIISVERNNNIRVLEVENGQELFVKEQTKSPYAISKDGKRIASTSSEEECTIIVWETETGNDLPKLVGHTKQIIAMAFSLDGKRLVSISEDGTIRHWSIDTGNELKILPCNILVGGKNNFIAFDSIGKHVVTYREEHVRVWDVDEGKEIMRVPNASISRVAFCPNGKRIGSVLTDRTIRIWDFPPLQDLIDQTRERFKDRPLTAEERRQYYLE